MLDTSLLKKGDLRGRGLDRAAQLESFIERHGMQLLRAARRYSETAADAEDAYQGTLEVLLSKAPDGYDDDRLLAWALTVARNEALMERRRNEKVVHGAFEEIAARIMDHSVETDERIVEAERLDQGREALERVTPNQMRCLLLRADGLNYTEISEITGFSYAKVNRCLSEGRKAFHRHVERVESGAECNRLASVLSMMADDTASPEAKADAELHLEHCVACRATLRDYRDIPGRAAYGLPLGLVLLSGEVGARPHGFWQRIGDAFESAYANVQERLFGHASTIHQSGEFAAAKKVAAVAAATATLVVGGAAVQHATSGPSNGADRQPVAPASSSSNNSPWPVLPGGQPGVAAAERARERRRQKARSASENDVRRATRGTKSETTTSSSSTQGQSAGDGGEFNPQPQTAEPSVGGTSDPETGLAP